MDKKKIIILIVIIAAAAYYFYSKGSAQSDTATNGSQRPEDYTGPASVDIVQNGYTPPGKILATSTNKEIASYYSKKLAENPFLNPIILPGFLLKRLKPKNKK